MLSGVNGVCIVARCLFNERDVDGSIRRVRHHGLTIATSLREFDAVDRQLGFRNDRGAIGCLTRGPD